MDHCELLLETKLSQLLDPIVDMPAPPRRGRRRDSVTKFKAIVGGLKFMLPDMVVLAEPVKAVAISTY